MRSNSQKYGAACVDWQAEISDVLHSDLESDIRTSWESHALKCDICAKLAELDRDVISNIQQLPIPDSVDILGSVMEQINKSDVIHYGIKPQHFAWGLSSAVVGFFLGFVISGMTLEPTIAATIDEYFEQTFTDLHYGIDSLVTALTDYNEDEFDE